MDLSPFNAIATKLEKDELFTFIYGFALGIIGFLIYFVEFSLGDWRKPVFISSDPYLLIFSFLGIGLFFTFITHVLYNLIGIPLFKAAGKGLQEDFNNSLYVDAPRYDWCVNINNMTEWAHLLHIYQLSLTAILMLMIFPVFVYFKHLRGSDVCIGIWGYEIITAIVFIVGSRYVYEEWKKYLIIYRFINNNNVKIFYDNNSYSIYKNQIVDVRVAFHLSQLNSSISQGFNNMIEGLSRL